MALDMPSKDGGTVNVSDAVLARSAAAVSGIAGTGDRPVTDIAMNGPISLPTTQGLGSGQGQTNEAVRGA